MKALQLVWSSYIKLFSIVRKIIIMEVFEFIAKFLSAIKLAVRKCLSNKLVLP